MHPVSRWNAQIPGLPLCSGNRFRVSDPSKKLSSGDLHPILASSLQVEKSKIYKTCSPFALLEIFNAKKYERNPFEQPNSLEQLQTGAYLLWHWEKDIGIMDKDFGEAGHSERASWSSPIALACRSERSWLIHSPCCWPPNFEDNADADIEPSDVETSNKIAVCAKPPIHDSLIEPFSKVPGQPYLRRWHYGLDRSRLESGRCLRQTETLYLFSSFTPHKFNTFTRHILTSTFLDLSRAGRGLNVENKSQFFSRYPLFNSQP